MLLSQRAATENARELPALTSILGTPARSPVARAAYPSPEPPSRALLKQVHDQYQPYSTFSEDYGGHYVYDTHRRPAVQRNSGDATAAVAGEAPSIDYRGDNPEVRFVNLRAEESPAC
jgi:hypothetical protein